MFKNIKGGLSIEDARFVLDVENGFGIDAEMKVNDIIGINDRKPKNVKLSSSEFDQPIFIRKAINSGSLIPSRKVIVLDKSNSNLKLFLENLPNEIHPDLNVTIRPNGTIDQGDFAFDISALNVDVSLFVPLTFGLDSLELLKEEKFSLFEDEDVSNISAAKDCCSCQ